MTDASFRLTIDGRSVAGDRHFEVVDPATGESGALAPAAGVAHVEQTMAAMRAAQPGWAATPHETRATALRAGADAIEGNVDELAALSTLELGSPMAFSRGLALALAGALRHFAELKAPSVVLCDDATRRVEVLRRPVGPVAAITPWNAPLYMLGLKIAPALAAGNTVVVKPSPNTPLATLRAGELLQSALPPGVLNVLSGTDELGPLLTGHETIRKVTFTGSIPVGKAIAAAAATDLKRVTLELGGNDPAIILDDADVDGIAAKLFWAAFTNCGQVCIAVKRVYVPERLHDRLVDALAQLARTVVVGPGTESNTQIGPQQNQGQRERLHELVLEAAAQGAQIAAGGAPLDRPGYFYPPTVVGRADARMRLVDEEQFGPALPVIPYVDVDDAIAQANHRVFGLGASVWTSDLRRADAVADRLEAGQVWINTHQATLGFGQPLTGVKHSGLGIEKGLWGLESFTEIQTRFVDSG